MRRRYDAARRDWGSIGRRRSPRRARSADRTAPPDPRSSIELFHQNVNRSHVRDTNQDHRAGGPTRVIVMPRIVTCHHQLFAAICPSSLSINPVNEFCIGSIEFYTFANCLVGPNHGRFRHPDRILVTSRSNRKPFRSNRPRSCHWDRNGTDSDGCWLSHGDQSHSSLVLRFRVDIQNRSPFLRQRWNSASQTYGVFS